jgi:hypothetical protein
MLDRPNLSRAAPGPGAACAARGLNCWPASIYPLIIQRKNSEDALLILGKAAIRNRMRESCTYGSVRGVRGNSHPYRDRRDLIALLGGTAVSWPVGARAQQQERVRRVGVVSIAENDPEGQTRLAVFKAMQQLGWSEGRNLQIIPRWGAGEADSIRRYAAELVALAPDVILATGSATVGPLLQATRTVPIIFVYVPDPVGAGFREQSGATGRQRHRIYAV